MPEETQFNFKESLLARLTLLKEKIAKTGDKTQVDEVNRWEAAIKENLIITEVAESDGVKELISLMKLEYNIAVRSILNRDLFNKDPETYYKETAIAFGKIEQIEWFISMLDRKGNLDMWQKALDNELK